MDPWGTSDKTGKMSERVSSILTHCVLPDRNDLNHNVAFNYIQQEKDVSSIKGIAEID